MFSMVLEVLVDSRQLYGNQGVSTTTIADMFKHQGIPRQGRAFAPKVNTVLLQMAWAGLIVMNGETVSLAEEGIKAYREQRYHDIAANLYNAEQTKRLSLVAIWIASVLSVLSIIATILIAWLK